MEDYPVFEDELIEYHVASANAQFIAGSLFFLVGFLYGLPAVISNRDTAGIIWVSIWVLLVGGSTLAIVNRVIAKPSKLQIHYVLLGKREIPWDWIQKIRIRDSRYRGGHTYCHIRYGNWLHQSVTFELNRKNSKLSSDAQRLLAFMRLKSQRRYETNLSANIEPD